MAWNKQQIKKNLEELQRRITYATSEEDLLAAKFDYASLCLIYNSIEKEKPIITEEQDHFSICKDFIQQSAEALLAYKQKLTTVMKVMENQPCLQPKNSRVKEIYYIRYIQMVIHFFYSLDDDYHSLFKTISPDNVEFAKTRKATSKASGLCYYLHSLKEPYIITDKKIMKNFDTLPHEIGHVKDFSVIKNFYQSMNFRCSTFLETNPKLLALLFDEFYQETELKLLCLNQKKAFFDRVRASIEVYSSSISNIDSYDFKTKTFIVDNSFATNVPKGYLNHIVSDLLAIFLLNLYKNDRNAFNDFMSSYHSLKGINDAEIWKLIDFNELARAVKEEMYSFNSDVYNTRKRSKTFDLI